MEKKYSVFVSSTYEDLQEERKKVMGALLQMNCFPVGMEYFNASDESQWSVIKHLIDECDYYVIILAGKYGSIDEESGKSFTQKEYEYAQSINVPILSFVHKDITSLAQAKCESEPDKREKLQQFKSIVQKKLCRMWNNSDELASQVILSLNSAITSLPRTGWMRANHLSDDESAKEILRLKDELDSLRLQIRQIEEEDPKDTFELEQGEDTFTINFQYPNSFAWEYITYNSTWKEIIEVLSPLMVIESSENELKKALVDHVKYKEKNEYGLEIISDDFQTIKVQLLALHIIQESIKKRPVHDQQSYWTLTPYGKRLLIGSKAIKKQTRH